MKAEAVRWTARAEVFEARAASARQGVLLFGPDEQEDPEFLSTCRPLIASCRDRGDIAYGR